MPVSGTRIESQLQQAWSALFPGTAVGLDDDFFMLAGEGSAGLLALRARSGMERLLGRDIPLSLLVKYPTIRELAAFLAESLNLEWPLAVKLEEGPADRHFFLFPPLDGNSIWYRPLAAELGNCCTVWGLEIPGLDKRQRPIFSMPELASRFVGEIRSIQAKGPYFLGGYSFGGLLAFEAAIQLEAEGETIAILAMLDRSCPIAGKSVMGGMVCPSALIPGHLSLAGKIDAHWNWTTRWIKTRVRLAKGGKRWKENARVPDTRKIMKAAALQMMAFYRPKSRLGGKMVLLRQEGTGPADRGLDETYGWKGHVESRIDIRIIPGPHSEVLDGRNTGILASHLRPYLERERKPGGDNRMSSPLIAKTVVEKDKFTVFPGEGLGCFIRGELSVSYAADIDLREVDPSILAVPFILNAAPAVWGLGLHCTVPVMDRAFYEALEEIRNGYRTLYPEYPWQGSIEPGSLVEAHSGVRQGDGRRILFFSGGVDSTYSALESAPEGTTLLTVRGHDMALDNDAAWGKAMGRIRRFADDLGFRTATVSANVFRFLRYTPLHERFPKLKPWYGTIQHALSLAGLAFPLASSWGVPEIGFSSSNDAIVAHLPWGAHGLLEPRIRAGGITVRSIGADLDWIRKTEAIARFYRENPGLGKPFLRVCLNRMSGDSTENCGSCVKCLRRATALLLFGEDPNDYGFSLPQPVFRTVRERCLGLECTLFDTYYWPEMATLARDRFEDASEDYRDFFAWLSEWKPAARIASHNDFGGNP